MLFPDLELSMLLLACICVIVVILLSQTARLKRDNTQPMTQVAVSDNEKKQIARLSYQLEALEFKNRAVESKYSKIREMVIEEDINTELGDKLQAVVAAVKEGKKANELSGSFEISDCEAELIEAVHGKLNRFSDRTLH